MPQEPSLQTRVRMTEAGITKAQEAGIAVTIAIVDAGGHLMHLTRMDEAMLASVDLAWQKARASVLFRRPSAELGAITRPDAHAYGLQWSNQGLVCVGGGLPLTAAAAVVGAVGVSGGSIDEDIAIAQECLNELAREGIPG